MLVYGTFVLKRWLRLAQPGPATDCRWGSDLSRASAGEGSAMAGAGSTRGTPNLHCNRLSQQGLDETTLGSLGIQVDQANHV